MPSRLSVRVVNVWAELRFRPDHSGYRYLIEVREVAPHPRGMLIEVERDDLPALHRACVAGEPIEIAIPE